MSVSPDYLLCSVKLYRAALNPFRLEELITFDGSMFQLGATLLVKKLCLSPKKKCIIVASPALEAFPVVTQIMSSCSCFDVQMFFPFYDFLLLNDLKDLYQVTFTLLSLRLFRPPIFETSSDSL